MGRDDRRRALVWCGTELLTERGFQVTGIDEVLKCVGVPKGCFHHFFADKHGYGEAVTQNHVDCCAREMMRNADPLDRFAVLYFEKIASPAGGPR